MLYPYAKVNGAYLLTNSKIKFGTENTVTPQYYHTTTRSNFSAKCEPVERRDWQTTYSNVCLDYYGMFPIRIHQLSFKFKFQKQNVVIERVYTKNVTKLLVHLITIFSNFFHLHATLKVMCTKRCCSHVNEL